MNKLIYQLRKKLHISQSELATKAGVCQSTISRIERTCLAVNYKIIFKILIYLQSREFGTNNPIKTVFSKQLIAFLFSLTDFLEIQQFICKDPEKAVRFFSSCFFKTYPSILLKS